ncbi:aminotransferase class IV [Candidatus Neomarinimicrobiota bacterium]
MSANSTSKPQDPLIYINGEWVPHSVAKVPFMDSGFWFGDGLFETLKVTNGNIFRPDKHISRMREGMKILQIDFPVPDEQVIALMKEMVERNQLENTLLRLMCTRGTLKGAPYKHSGPSNLYIGFRYIDTLPDFPLKVHFVNERDYPLGRMYPALKSMTYLPNMLATRDAVAHGAFEPVFINRAGLVTECATRNIFFVKQQVLKTPDLNLKILPGVTRDLIIDLAQDMGLQIDTAPIKADSINEMDEAFISSTGIGVCPCTWEGFPGSDYSITYQLREKVESTVQKETLTP